MSEQRAPAKPKRRRLALVGAAIMSMVAVAGVSAAAYFAWTFYSIPDKDLASYRPATATRVFAWDGTLIGEYSDQRRVYVPYDQMPPQLVNAFLAAEDRNFFHHGGVDVSGLGRAMFKDVLNVAQGRRLEGGSTITQQVAKNILVGNDTTIARKVKEAVVAGRLEHQLSKQHILELYLNEIWLGYRSYGVAIAAYNYFGKSLNQLTLPECAYLAALPKGPDNYDPKDRKAQAISRRNWILDQMVETGAVTRADAEAAKKTDLVVQPGPSRARYSYADFFVEEVRRNSLTQTYGKAMNKGGYYIRTTLDSTLQEQARNALMNGLEKYDHRHGWRGATMTANPASAWRPKALTLPVPSERTGWRPAIVQSIAGADVRVQPAAEGAPAGALAPEDVGWAKAGKGLNVGDIIYVEAGDGGRYRLRQIPAVNGAMVAIDPHTGRVLAMVGGYSFSISKFNRATQAQRQPGSAFKPFVYATALEGDFTPASVILDGPITLKGANGADWTPENYGHDFLGPLVLRKGLELSRNTMTVRVAQATGMNKVAANAVKFGVVDHMEPVLAMALGAGETTPLRLAGAYSAFINGGRRIDPHMIEVVQDRDGKTIYRADKRKCDKCVAGFNGSESPRLTPEGVQVMDPITAYQINSMLQGVVQRGTAAAASSLGRPLGGKTGTTNEFRSAWFVGFTPDMVVATFIGFDDNRSLGSGETGAVAALPVFIDFMTHVPKDPPGHVFAPPPNAKFMLVNGIMEAFRPGTELHVDNLITPGDIDIGAPTPKIVSPTFVTPDLSSVRPVTPQAPPAPPTPQAPPQPRAPPPPPPPPKKVQDNLEGLY